MLTTRLPSHPFLEYLLDISYPVVVWLHLHFKPFSKFASEASLPFSDTPVFGSLVRVTSTCEPPPHDSRVWIHPR